MTNIKQAESLLERVGLIRWKHSDVLRDARYQFNVFSMLREPHDEVHLHSRFLAELLDPRGDHCQQDVFLRRFLQLLDIGGFPSEDARVHREYDNIDVFVAAGDHALIIENKIYAGDQDRQLERYFRAVRGMGFEHIGIVYLTLRGDSPSRQSLGDLTEESMDQGLHCLSYEDDVHSWLDACIEAATQNPVVRETLVQYQRLVEMLTGHPLSRGYIMELKDLLMDEETIALAVDIGQALVKAKIEIQFAFWKDLEARLRREDFALAADRAACPRYSRKRVQRYYERNRRKRYGIAIPLGKLPDDTELLFFVQVRSILYYSFIVVRDDDRNIAQEPQFDHLAEICTQVDESFKRSKRSLGWKGAKRRVSFKDFNSATAFALADPDKRQRYVDDFVAEITGLIEAFMDRLSDWRDAQKGLEAE